MALTDQIQKDIIAAMKAKEADKLAALRDIKSKILLEATSGSGEVTEAVEQKIILKLYKQRMDSYNLYIEQGREDLAGDEKFQAEVIKAYMPEQMSEEDIRKAVLAKMDAVGASGMADMGKIMGALSKELAGKADGSIISKIVKEELGKL